MKRFLCWFKQIGAVATVLVITMFLSSHTSRAVEFDLDKPNFKAVEVANSPARYWATGTIESGDRIVTWCSQALRSYGVADAPAARQCWFETAKQAGVDPKDLHKISIGDTFLLPLKKTDSDAIAVRTGTRAIDEQKSVSVVQSEEPRSQSEAALAVALEGYAKKFAAKRELRKLQDQEAKREVIIAELRQQNAQLIERISALESKLLVVADKVSLRQIPQASVIMAAVAPRELMSWYKVYWMSMGAAAFVGALLLCLYALYLLYWDRSIRKQAVDTAKYHQDQKELQRAQLAVTREENKELIAGIDATHKEIADLKGKLSQLKKDRDSRIPGYMRLYEVKNYVFKLELVGYARNLAGKLERQYRPVGETGTDPILESNLTKRLTHRLVKLTQSESEQQNEKSDYSFKQPVLSSGQLRA